MPLQAIWWAVLVDASDLLQWPLEGRLGLRLATCAWTPVTISLKELRRCARMVFIHVWPNLAKSLKTRSSQRTLPLVGYSKLALEQALKQADDAHLFPKYIRDAKCYATNASNALSKWLKKDFDGLNAHCLRHTFRDRLRAVECAMDHIGGCELVNSIWNIYGEGYRMVKFQTQFDAVQMLTCGKRW